MIKKNFPLIDWAAMTLFCVSSSYLHTWELYGSWVYDNFAKVYKTQKIQINIMF